MLILSSTHNWTLVLIICKILFFLQNASGAVKMVNGFYTLEPIYRQLQNSLAVLLWVTGSGTQVGSGSHTVRHVVHKSRSCFLYHPTARQGYKATNTQKPDSAITILVFTMFCSGNINCSLGKSDIDNIAYTFRSNPCWINLHKLHTFVFWKFSSCKYHTILYTSMIYIYHRVALMASNRT